MILETILATRAQGALLLSLQSGDVRDRDVDVWIGASAKGLDSRRHKTTQLPSSSGKVTS